MKKVSALIILAVLSTALITGCSKDIANSNQLNNEQTVLFAKMNLAYNHANSFNDSFSYCSKFTHSDSLIMNYYDSCFHYNDSLFSHCNIDLMKMMIGNNGMMQNNVGMMDGTNYKMCNNEMVNNLIYEMSALRLRHNLFHP